MVMTRSYRSFARAGLLVAVIALAGCQAATEDPTPTDAPSSAASIEPTASASDAPTASADASPGGGEETSVFDLAVGDCFSTDSDQLETVNVVDCEQPHEHEVFALFDHTAGDAEPYPGDDEMIGYADTECQPPFEDYVGFDYQTSIWYITSLTPLGGDVGRWRPRDRLYAQPAGRRSGADHGDRFGRGSRRIVWSCAPRGRRRAAATRV